MTRKDYDVIVIGGGLLGCFAARNLARYDLRVALLEKRDDLCMGMSRANTAIVYSGCDTKPGTRKTTMCVSASQGFEDLCAELGVRYSKCGSIMICFGERGAGVLRKKLEQGIQNGVRGVRMLTRGEVLELEPNVSADVYAGLYAPDTGTVMPWELCLAAAENAARNGVDIIMNADVDEISRGSGGYVVKARGGLHAEAHLRGVAAVGVGEPDTSDNADTAAVGAGELDISDNASDGLTSAGEPDKSAKADEVVEYRTRAVVNCAGLNADTLLEKVFEPVVRIVPDAGDYYVLDTKTQGFIRHVIFHEPEEKGKGLTLVPTVEGNILVGPTERVQEQDAAGAFAADDAGFETSLEGLESLRSLVTEVVPDLPMEHVIRSFGAIRPNPYEVNTAPHYGASKNEAKQMSTTRSSAPQSIAPDDSAPQSSAPHYGETQAKPSVTLSDRSVSDFSIIEAEGEAFISFIGVKTPGLTCANELGMYAAERVADKLCALPNENFDPHRQAQVRVSDMTFNEREALVRIDPAYGRIVCRCRGVTEGEVLDAIRTTPGAVTLNGVKHRTGTGLGRCQGGFCTQNVLELLARELGGSPEDYL